MNIANELAEKQNKQRELEQEKINRVAQTEAEARRLAEEMLSKHMQDRSCEYFISVLNIARNWF